jgi:phospholipid/cholesterol/gamma-HCH transport system permease protein
MPGPLASFAVDAPPAPGLRETDIMNTDRAMTPILSINSTTDLLSLGLRGSLDLRTTPEVMEQLARIHKPLPKLIRADLSGITRMDDCGALIILQLRRMADNHGCVLEMLKTPDHVQDLVNFLHLDTPPKPGGAKRTLPGIMTRFGVKTLHVVEQAKSHVSFVGEVTVTLFSLLRHPGRLRPEDTILYMQRVGVDALPIVGLISFLLGLIMAFMSAVQLQQFGANIYVASLVALAMVRELGPIMTAILVAGRSGSAFAAEIGTMKVSEEVDALVTMGFKPTMFLVAPKIIASILVVPLLAMYSNLFAVAGGLLIGVTALDLTVNAYMAQTMNTLTIFDINWGLFKSAIFAMLISTVGCFKGYQVRGGAASVGKATTSAVVTGIFLVILVDSILAVLLRYWRP